MNINANPADLIFYQINAASVDVRGTAGFVGRIIAPNGDVRIHGTPGYYGCVLGKTTEVMGTAQIHYDIDLEDHDPGENVPDVIQSELVGYPGC